MSASIFSLAMSLSSLALLSAVLTCRAQDHGPALKNLAEEKFLMGCSVGYDALFSDSEQAAMRRGLVAHHYNTITTENALKWGPTHPQPGVFTFERADRIVAFAEEHGMWMVGHTLVWHNQTPNWVFEGADREVLLDRMREHIHTVVGRYKGRVHAWDVVNEAIENNGKIKDNTPWARIIGPDYIEHAFRFAHEADPEAELYYNDYSMEIPAKRKATLELVQRLKDAGLRIDGIGMQGHYGLNANIKETENSIIAFAEAGMKVMFTELDMTVLPAAWKYRGADINDMHEYQAGLDPYTKSLPDDIAQKQADVYGALFRVMVNHADKIHRVTFWNVTDGDSWLNNRPVIGRTDYPLLFDRMGRPKPAFHAVVNALLPPRMN